MGKIKREIDLRGLPESKSGIDWEKSIGVIIIFKYGGVTGEFTIVEVLQPDKVKILYNEKEYIVSKENIRKCKLGIITGLFNKGCRYKEGDVLSGFIIIKHITNRKRQKTYECLCVKCNQISHKTETQLLNNGGCAFCSGRYPIRGKTDMWTTNPEMAKILLNPEDGYNYMEQSNTKLYWKCPNCGNVIYKTPNAVYKYKKLSCPECSKTKSYPNRLMFNILKELGICFESEKSFEWSKNGSSIRRYDFYFPELNIICEMHGRQHYEDGFRTTYEEIHENDLYKKRIATQNNICRYIEIDCRKSDLDWIKNNLLSSKLSEFIDFSKVNWEEIDSTLQNSLMIETCTLWNSGVRKRKELVDIIGIRPEGIYLHLKRGSELGLCSYNKKESIKIGQNTARKTYYQSNSSPILCLNNNYVFGSVGICEKESFTLFGIKLDRHNITKTADGTQSSTKGYIFKHITKNEFNLIKRNKETSHLAFGDFFILQESEESTDV